MVVVFILWLGVEANKNIQSQEIKQASALTVRFLNEYIFPKKQKQIEIENQLGATDVKVKIPWRLEVCVELQELKS